MGMHKREMHKGLRCFVTGHLIADDMTSPFIQSKATILQEPYLSTVLVRLDDPPKKVAKEINVPVNIVYWTKQNMQRKSD